MNSLFLLTVIVALAIPYFLPNRQDGQVDESQLDAADRAIINQLRSDGLDIEMFHICGMGDLATFTIDETEDGEFHVTNVYVKDENAVSFVADIVKFPELRSLEISSFASLQLTISYPSCKNPDTVKEAINRFMKLEKDIELNHE